MRRPRTFLCAATPMPFPEFRHSRTRRPKASWNVAGGRSESAGAIPRSTLPVKRRPSSRGARGPRGGGHYRRAADTPGRVSGMRGDARFSRGGAENAEPRRRRPLNEAGGTGSPSGAGASWSACSVSCRFCPLRPVVSNESFQLVVRAARVGHGSTPGCFARTGNRNGLGEARSLRDRWGWAGSGGRTTVGDLP